MDWIKPRARLRDQQAEREERGQGSDDNTCKVNVKKTTNTSLSTNQAAAYIHVCLHICSDSHLSMVITELKPKTPCCLSANHRVTVSRSMCAASRSVFCNNSIKYAARP